MIYLFMKTYIKLLLYFVKMC